jgi:hypothetical protein
VERIRLLLVMVLRERHDLQVNKQTPKQGTDFNAKHWSFQIRSIFEQRTSSD